MKFTYFVGNEFDRRFSSQKVDEMELKIEDYIMDLKIKCTQEAKAQKDFIVIEKGSRNLAVKTEIE